MDSEARPILCTGWAPMYFFISGKGDYRRQDEIGHGTRSVHPSSRAMRNGAERPSTDS